MWRGDERAGKCMHFSACKMGGIACMLGSSLLLDENAWLKYMPHLLRLCRYCSNCNRQLGTKVIDVRWDYCSCPFSYFICACLFRFMQCNASLNSFSDEENLRESESSNIPAMVPVRRVNLPHDSMIFTLNDSTSIIFIIFLHGFILFPHLPPHHKPSNKTLQTDTMHRYSYPNPPR